MSTEDTSTLGTYIDDPVSNDQHDRTLLIQNDTDGEDMNNSLVFANDSNIDLNKREKSLQVKDTDKPILETDSSMLFSPTQRDTSSDHKSAPTQVDNLNYNSNEQVGDTLEDDDGGVNGGSFTQRLNVPSQKSSDNRRAQSSISRYPYNDVTTAPRKLHTYSPGNNSNLNFEDTQRINDNLTNTALSNNENAKGTQMISGLKYNTQTSNDQERSHVVTYLPETQIINQPETQLTEIYADTQALHNQPDTQVINNDRPHTREPYKNDAETQIMTNGENNSSVKCNGVETIEHNDDTQRVNFENSFTQTNSPLNPLSNNELSYTPNKANDNNRIPFYDSPGDKIIEIQVPNTTEKNSKSVTQVVNTQEEMMDETFRKVDLGSKPVYSSSQRIPGADDRDIAIKSDDDQDLINDDSGLLFEDSMLTNKLMTKKRKRSGNEQKRNKNIRLDFSEKTTLSKADSSFDLKASADVPSEDVSANYGSKKDEETSQKNIRVLPSSPTKESLESTELSDLSQSVNDIQIEVGSTQDVTSGMDDLEEHRSDAEEDHMVITRNRRNTRQKYVIQSQNDTTKAESSGVDPSSNDPSHLTQDNKSPMDILRKETLNSISESLIKHISSTFAMYKFKIYPGIITDSVDPNFLTVAFNEGEFDIKNTDLFLLDIRVGDKVELRGKKVKYIVTGLGFNDKADDIKCMRGFNLVYLIKFSKSKLKTNPEVSIPLSEIIMEFSDFIRHQQFNQVIIDGKDRLKDNYLILSNILGKLQTIHDGPDMLPIQVNGKSDDITRKLTKSPIKLSRSTSYRASPRKKNTIIDKVSNLFSGCLFLLTSVEEEEKDEIQSLITKHDGVIVEESLNEILQYFKTNSGSVVIRLDFLKKFKFGAIIASNHCRSAKYLQGLAIGWPILSRLFIYDCVKDHLKFSHWPIYLLPAGQSTYLNSIKSLDVYKFRYNYEVKKNFLIDQLQNNVHLLQGYSIIILKQSTNSATLEMCEFIFYCFGVGNLTWYNNYEAMKKNFAKDSNYDNVLAYINDDFEGETEGNEENEVNFKLNNPDMMRIGIIDWEWVVQCVISQYIWEPKKYLKLSCK